MSNPNKKILSTKLLSENILHNALLKGTHIICKSFIKTELYPTLFLQNEIGIISTNDIFIFTSSNAVKAMATTLNGYNNDAYCIEGETQKFIQQNTSLNIVATGNNAKDICDKIDIDFSKNYIFCCGNKSLYTIPDFFKKNHIKLKKVVCYSTIATPLAIDEYFDGILFFSPSGVHSYFSKNKINTDQKIYCIGNTTASSVMKYSNNIFIAQEPTIESLLSLIEK